MRVTVVAFGAIREALGVAVPGAPMPAEVDDGATVEDLVRVLGLSEGLVFSVLVDGERTDLSAPLVDGSEVTLMPPFTGGQR